MKLFKLEYTLLKVFTYEKESNNSLTFLDILISRSENGFKTSVCHKPTVIGVYSNFYSLIYDQYKIGLSFTLLFRTFSIVSDFFRFHTVVSHLKEILRKNAFPIKLVDSCIKSFWIKRFCILPSHWLLRKKNSLLAYHILIIYLLLEEHAYRIVLVEIFLFVRSKLFLSPRHVLVNFSVLKIKCLLTYALMLFTNSRVVDPMLPIKAKFADI